MNNNFVFHRCKEINAEEFKENNLTENNYACLHEYFKLLSIVISKGAICTL